MELGVVNLDGRQDSSLVLPDPLRQPGPLCVRGYVTPELSIGGPELLNFNFLF